MHDDLEVEIDADLAHRDDSSVLDRQDRPSRFGVASMSVNSSLLGSTDPDRFVKAYIGLFRDDNQSGFRGAPGLRECSAAQLNQGGRQ